MFLVLTALLVVAASAALALLVFARNYRSPYNITFSLFAVALSLWIPANFFGSFHNPSPGNAWLFYTDFTLAPFLALFFMLFGIQSLIFYRPISAKLKSRSVFYMTTLLAAILSLSAMVKLVAIPQYSQGTVNALRQVLYYPYTAIEIIFALVGLASIVIAATSSAKLYKQQARTILAGVFVGTVTILASNIILPNLVKGASQSTIIAQDSSYFGALIMVFSFSYLIVRHRLFDVRAVIARSMGYILVLGALSSAFAVVLLIATTKFFPDVHLKTSTKIVYLATALLLAIIYQPLKRLFDKFTNTLFYRDAYDDQELLNNLNRSLVTTIELEALLNKSAEIISNTIKAEYCTFAIKGEDGTFRLIGSRENLSQRAFEKIQMVTVASSHLAEKIVLADELEANKRHLQEMMRSANVSAILKLQGHAKGHDQHPGYLLLGQKQSGGIYSPQDTKILEIIGDELVIAIQNALRFEEIQKFNITLQQKVEEATRELKKVNARLRELDKTKDEFISMASHQLRTPLTTVKGYLSMILEGDVGAVKKDQKELMQHAFDGANRMVYLIADLLNVSRLQTGKFVIDNKPTNLAEVVEGEMVQLNEQAANREIKLIYHKPASFPVLNLDETKIRQVVMNFLDNALYYTPKGGSVTVELSSTDKEVSYTVADTGVGVPKDVQHHLFSKFYRADNARKMRPDGTGLGLYMAKKVVAAQGGAIIFRSTEGKGSTFGFSFPRGATEIKAASEATKKTEQKDTATSVKAKT